MEDWHALLTSSSEEIPPSNWKVEAAVRGALSRLSDTEREIVERFFLCGEDTAATGIALKLPEYRVVNLLKQSRRQLKEQLARFVAKRYGLPVPAAPCRICLSKNRRAIEKLLSTKTKEETWKRILQNLRNEFQLCTSARSLARHLKRHQKPAKKKSGANIQ